MSVGPLVVAIDPDPRSARALADAFTRVDFRFHYLPDGRRVATALRSEVPDLLLVHGEPPSPVVRDVLSALVQDPRLSRLPVALLCAETTEGPLVAQFRSGVVELLAKPFSPFEHPARVRALLAELPERSGTVVGFQIARIVDHVQRTFRSGALKLNPGTPQESQAFFANGVLRSARHQDARGSSALEAMLALPRAPWAFVELSGQEGEGTGFVIELNDGSARPVAPRARPVAEEEEGFEVDLELDPVPEELGTPPLAVAQGVLAADADLAGDDLLLPQDDEVLELEPLLDEPVEGEEILEAAPEVPILLVDDDEELCRMFATLFRRHGYDVTTAQDGVTGYEAALGRGFELIVADLNMPRMDGWGLLRLLRDDYRTRETPFAMLSCQDDYRESLKAVDAGAQAYFPKTTRLDALVQHVSALLSPRQQFRRALAEGRISSIAVGHLGLQWVLRELGAHGLSGRLRARDSWAGYEVVFRKGVPVHAQAQTGGHQATGERALNALVASRCTDATWSVGELGDKQTLIAPLEELLARASRLLNDSGKKLRDALLVSPLDITVNEDLYRVYAHNGPKQWLETARMLCEERLTPREILARVAESPIEVEETLRDLVRRGVVSLSGAHA